MLAMLIPVNGVVAGLVGVEFAVSYRAVALVPKLSWGDGHLCCARMFKYSRRPWKPNSNSCFPLILVTLSSSTKGFSWFFLVSFVMYPKLPMLRPVIWGHRFVLKGLANPNLSGQLVPSTSPPNHSLRL